MGIVHRLGGGPATVPLAHAVEAFLAQLSTPNSARSDRIALRALVAELGPDTPVAVLDQEPTAERVGHWFTHRWAARAMPRSTPGSTRCARQRPGGAPGLGHR